jgi:type IV pilus assembly protein PilW
VITAINGIQLAVQASGNYHAGDSPDRVVAAPSAPLTGCSLTLATVSDVVAPNVSVHGSGAVDGGTLFNLGNNPRILAYAVRAGNLTVCDYLAADCGAACTALDPPTCSVAWVPIANNIVSLRAQYGHFTHYSTHYYLGSDYTAATHSRQTRRSLPANGPEPRRCVSQSSRATARSTRARSPRWRRSGQAVDGAAIDLSDRANWQNYRYKVFETVVPLRNLGWMAPCTL